MSEYILSCCSTADMPKEFFDRREISLICFHYVMDGREYPDDLGQTMPFDEFYARIKNGATPTTSQVNMTQYVEAFEPFLKAGKAILHICLSTGITGSYNSACLAREALLEEYPDGKLIILDSLGASAGYGLLVEMAADLRDGGMGIDELAAWVEDNKRRIQHWFFSTDLSSYYRGGRISKTSANIGTLLGICPLLNVDKDGRLIPRDKYRGKKRVVKEIVERMVKYADNGINYNGKCFISNSGCMDDAMAVADMIEKAFKNLDGPVRISSIGAVIGAHTGPGTVALFFYGNERKD